MFPVPYHVAVNGISIISFPPSNRSFQTVPVNAASMAGPPEHHLNVVNQDERIAQHHE
jgi:hypothetical protein